MQMLVRSVAAYDMETYCMTCQKCSLTTGGPELYHQSCSFTEPHATPEWSKASQSATRVLTTKQLPELELMFAANIMLAPLNWGTSRWKRNSSLIKQALAPLGHHLRYRRCRQRLVTNLVLHLYTTHCTQHTQKNCHML